MSREKETREKRKNDGKGNKHPGTKFQPEDHLSFLRKYQFP